MRDNGIAIIMNAGGIHDDATPVLWSVPRNLVLHGLRRRAMTPHQVSDIESGNFAAFDHPSTSDHDPVGPMCPAQDQRRKRVAVAGKP